MAETQVRRRDFLPHVLQNNAAEQAGVDGEANCVSH